MQCIALSLYGFVCVCRDEDSIVFVLRVREEAIKIIESHYYRRRLDWKSLKYAHNEHVDEDEDTECKRAPERARTRASLSSHIRR